MSKPYFLCRPDRQLLQRGTVGHHAAVELQVRVRGSQRLRASVRVPEEALHGHRLGRVRHHRLLPLLTPSAFL